jgi:hypothetical protein
VRRVSRSFLLLLGFLAAPCAFAQPFGRSGPEFVVPTTTTGDQVGSAVGVDLFGRFFVVWAAPDGDAHGVFGRRFNRNGSAIDASDFQVNVMTTNDQLRPSIAVARGLGFDAVVTWESTQLYARRFDSTGVLGGNLLVSSTGTPTRSRSAMSSSASWVTVWENAGDVMGQRYDSSGSALGGAFTITTSLVGQHVDVARAPSGQFVVVWKEATSGHIYARRYSGAGAPLDAGFQVSTFLGTGTYYPNVSANDDAFVVTWSQYSDPTDENVRARVFHSTGTPQTTDFRVNTYTTGKQYTSRAGMANDGSFVVVWTDNTDRDGGGPTSTSKSIWAQRYNAAGTPISKEFLVNSSTTANQFGEAIAMQSNGDFIVTWTSPKNSVSFGIYAQRYCRALAGDANDDGVLGVGDVFYLINALFAGGPPPLNNSDADGNGVTNVLDVFYLINTLFAGGPGPSCATPLI